ncbi:hypothetical protein A0H81_05670 [Grifola frondosa]|uniref:Uncharacterized protein n=1 Tax=Grifola frondosa TaxID=5627 RepID=A0A1C7MCI3_GRIFR|nr:hypothetical protein A0H81_05670 [Grifola frondosa]
MLAVRSPASAPAPFFKKLSERWGPLWSTCLCLGHHEADMVGTCVTAPPKPCNACGNGLEFIDWVYTALSGRSTPPTSVFQRAQNWSSSEGNRTRRVLLRVRKSDSCTLVSQRAVSLAFKKPVSRLLALCEALFHNI